VLPYKSSVKKKRAIFESILSDWIGYYSQLGMEVLLYDRFGGKHQPYMSDIANLHYYNYSIGQFMIPKSFSSKADKEGFDNVDSRLFSNRQVFNEDKVMTLTHCRFEARAVHGIDRVIVADIDEFLHCGDPASLEEARRNIDAVFRRYSVTGHTEISFLQRVTPSRNVAAESKGVVSCALGAISRNASVLSCYASTRYLIDAHEHKTLYTGFSCPYTSYHEGCNQAPQGEPPLYGVCSSCFREVEPRFCFFVHIATKAELFSVSRFEEAYPATANTTDLVDRSKIEASELELAGLLRSRQRRSINN
jgi:hypothetical protein